MRTRLTRLRARFLMILLLPLVGIVGCGPGGDAGGDMEDASAVIASAEPTLPPAEEGALAALNTSPRHGEWVDVPMTGSDTPIRTWAVYPERSDDAPVVIVIMEIYGLTDWIRSVADQLAADGFIALAPDLLSGMGPSGGGTESLGSRDDVVAAVRSLERPEAMSRLDAVRQYALTIPSATDEVGVVGYCWGGGTSFAYHKRQISRESVCEYSRARGYHQKILFLTLFALPPMTAHRSCARTRQKAAMNATRHAHNAEMMVAF